MVWIRGPLVVLVSTFISLLLAEGVLWSADLYSDLANSSLKPSNTVWTRQTNHLDTRRHPDLDHQVEIRFDRWGVRNHSDIDIQRVDKAIGFFGDSLTENRGLEDKFAVTSYLNQFWGQFHAINFGIAGFGLEQSFQRWMNYKDDIPLSHVVYVFSSNDLRNLYEVQLFELRDSDGELILVNRYTDEESLPLKHKIYRALGRLRITYLVMDAYYKTRGRLLDSSEFVERFLNVGSEVRRQRFHDTYADSMIQEMLSGNPSEQTIEWSRKFSAILEKWKNEVEATGSQFHIAVPPYEVERALFPTLLGDSIGKYRVLVLQGTESVDALKKYSNVFANDDHWNEFGNLAAVESFLRYFSEFSYPFNKSFSEFAYVKALEIEKFYADNHGAPNPSDRK